MCDGKKKNLFERRGFSFFKLYYSSYTYICVILSLYTAKLLRLTDTDGKICESNSLNL